MCSVKALTGSERMGIPLTSMSRYTTTYIALDVAVSWFHISVAFLDPILHTISWEFQPAEPSETHTSHCNKNTSKIITYIIQITDNAGYYIHAHVLVYLHVNVHACIYMYIHCTWIGNISLYYMQRMYNPWIIHRIPTHYQVVNTSS